MVWIKGQSDKRFLLESCASQLDDGHHQDSQENASFQYHDHKVFRLVDLNIKPTAQVTKKVRQLSAFEAESLDAASILQELCEQYTEHEYHQNLSSGIALREFAEICRANPHLLELISVHDEIANLRAFFSAQVAAATHDYDDTDYLSGATTAGATMPGQTIKMVGLRKRPNEPLGLTVELDEHNQLVVARILSGGVIDKQGLLHPGDVILEVNGVAVTTPEDLQVQISHSKSDSLTLKIGPSVEEEMKMGGRLVDGGTAQASQRLRAQNLEPGKKMTCYMRAQFDYEPTLDNLLPCQDIGLSFKRGDILQIINVKDPNWWQARHAGTEGPTGLVPSQELEERRQAYVPPEADYVHKISICGTRISKKKRKSMYKTKSCNEFDKAEMMLYEEVTKMPPFRRKTLVLVGVQGVGRRTLKNRLINSDAEKFGTIIPHTTRPPRVLEENGQTYWFIDRETMEDEVRNNNMLEYGEHNGNIYGTHLDSIRTVIQQGKMCVLDCAPNSLKLLHNSQEFLPYVVFIAAPGMEQLKQIYAERRATGGSQRNLAFDRQSSIRFSSRRARTLESLASLYEDDDLVSTVEESALLQRKYEKYIDMVVVNEDPDVTFRTVVQALENLAHSEQFVPVNWIY